MIPEFKNLTQEEQSLMIEAPAILSVLAATTTGEIKEWEKADAIQLAHLKTFSAHPLLKSYYQEVERVFEDNFDSIVRLYSPFTNFSRGVLQKEVGKIDAILKKLDHEFAVTLRTSLFAYADHVKSAYKGLIVNFLFPFPIAGLTQ